MTIAAFLPLLLAARQRSGGIGKSLIAAAGQQGSNPLAGLQPPGANTAQGKQTGLLDLILSEKAKVSGGYDPLTGIDWKQGRQKFTPGGAGPHADPQNQLAGMQALGK